jgi:hypothetical protein
MAKPQRRGERCQVRLLGGPGDALAAGVVTQQRDRHAERRLSGTERLDAGQDVVPPGVVENLADLAERVLECVGVPGARRLVRQRRAEHLTIVRLDLGALPPSGPCDHAPGGAVVLRIVGEELQLVAGVEGDQVAWPPVAAEQRAKPRPGEHPLDERLAQRRVVQAALVFDGQQRICRHQPLGVHAFAPAVGGPPGLRVTGDSTDAAARRLRLEDVAVQIRRQRQRRHRIGVVGSATAVHQASGVCEPEGFTRRTQSDLHLGAVRHPVDVRRELVGEEPAAAVPAVVADLLAEQAAGHPDPRPDVAGAALHIPTLFSVGSFHKRRWRVQPARCARKPSRTAAATLRPVSVPASGH